MEPLQSRTYFLARLPIGMSFLGHGLARIPRLSEFANGMVGGFTGTWLPQTLVLVFGYILPIVELLLGLALLAGVAMRKSSAFGVILMCVLIFGSSLQASWSSVATQMFYGLYFSLLYLFADYNGYALFPSTTEQ